MFKEWNWTAFTILGMFLFCSVLFQLFIFFPHKLEWDIKSELTFSSFSFKKHLFTLNIYFDLISWNTLVKRIGAELSESNLDIQARLNLVQILISGEWNKLGKHMEITIISYSELLSFRSEVNDMSFQKNKAFCSWPPPKFSEIFGSVFHLLEGRLSLSLCSLSYISQELLYVQNSRANYILSMVSCLVLVLRPNDCGQQRSFTQIISKYSFDHFYWAEVTFQPTYIMNMSTNT